MTQESLEFELVFYVLNAGYGNFTDAQQVILIAVMEALEATGMSNGVPARCWVLELRKGGDSAGRATTAATSVKNAAAVATQSARAWNGRTACCWRLPS